MTTTQTAAPRLCLADRYRIFPLSIMALVGRTIGAAPMVPRPSLSAYCPFMREVRQSHGKGHPLADRGFHGLGFAVAAAASLHPSHKPAGLALQSYHVTDIFHLSPEPGRRCPVLDPSLFRPQAVRLALRGRTGRFDVHCIGNRYHLRVARISTVECHGGIRFVF